MVETEAVERVAAPDWTSLPDDKLLEIRMCDLGLSLDGTEVQQRIAQVNAELDARGLVRPHYWLSDEWFTPDGVPGLGGGPVLPRPSAAGKTRARADARGRRRRR
jgi:hypothetical protein